MVTRLDAVQQVEVKMIAEAEKAHAGDFWR